MILFMMFIIKKNKIIKKKKIRKKNQNKSLIQIFNCAIVIGRPYVDETLHATSLVANRNALGVPAVFIICTFYRKSTKDDIVKSTLHVYKMF